MVSTPKRLQDMVNIGAKFEQALMQVGIDSPHQLQNADPFEVYARLKRSVPGSSLVALYALIGAVENRHWLEVKRDRRTEILLRLDDMGIAPK
jgi:DNA transformation protein